MKDENHLVYVGTYTGGGSEGIYLCQLNKSTGELSQIGVTRNVDNPSYLAIDAEHKLRSSQLVVGTSGYGPAGMAGHRLGPIQYHNRRGLAFHAICHIDIYCCPPADTTPVL